MNKPTFTTDQLIYLNSQSRTIFRHLYEDGIVRTARWWKSQRRDLIPDARPCGRMTFLVDLKSVRYDVYAEDQTISVTAEPPTSQ